MTTPNIKQLIELPPKVAADLTGNEFLEMQEPGGGPGSSKKIALHDLIYRFGDVPNDGVTYGRKNRAWFALPSVFVSTVNGQAPDGTGAVSVPASHVPYTPVGLITAADVQAAIAQVLALAGYIPIRIATTTEITLLAADAGGAVHGSNAAAIALTIPKNSDVAYPVGYSTLVRQTGAGVITITAPSGVTLRNGMPTAKTAGQYTGSISLHKIATDEWYLDGFTST